MLGPALAAYEMERISSVSIGNAEFAAAVKGAVPLGYTFRGIPIQFMHRVPRRMIATMLKAKACAEVMNSRGDEVCIFVPVPCSFH